MTDIELKAAKALRDRLTSFWEGTRAALEAAQKIHDAAEVAVDAADRAYEEALDEYYAQPENT